MANQNSSSLVRVVKDDVEFFTVAATGESGMSVSGLAILCGVSKQSVSKLLNNLSTKSPSKWLDPFTGRDLNLSTEGIKKGGKVQILKASVCSAVVRHYAFSGNETAQFSLTKFSDEGMTGWIQDITGWKKRQPDPAIDSDQSPVEIKNENQGNGKDLDAFHKARARRVRSACEELGLTEVPKEWQERIIADAANGFYLSGNVAPPVIEWLTISQLRHQLGVEGESATENSVISRRISNLLKGWGTPRKQLNTHDAIYQFSPTLKEDIASLVATPHWYREPIKEQRAKVWRRQGKRRLSHSAAAPAV